MLGSNNLVSTATFFKKSSYNTHHPMKDPTTATRQIDHVLIKQTEKRRMINCETKDWTEISSDHDPVILTLRINEKVLKKKKNHKRQRSATINKPTKKKIMR